ncbi:hypothetical protein Gbth_017_173 [Gluconobacter thailandicus F149-1 = NBRC 100600]|uniref:DUF2635 domain-containing protein n=1 Tax=Gluconobacter thailandicus NBRC 3257 TaxID=1381097 RepID=A0ABQ0IW98_GLUTH|nr:hypothetical protein [Gluconobacter thailandicus]GAN89915.1 hypothetical protein Gbfr_009_040 [Gluconobacter frateurii M-2]KXV54151.1 hypothetical protein AD946_04240 [Gluconobacter thailandicus]GAC87864.1 hypothetical protein NBRC3255_1525 [Gluconobacter thailandicus NBRC 3255]GAD26461.1 hypothetical protein NBRC3257_1460 [Gluconobacter thailandicus NBRC 3257]GAN92998.1 hypothetical protein Gbth_017_173 [Gluconobacter thailandicus F149-1 = NBRC 100600]
MTVKLVTAAPGRRVVTPSGVVVPDKFKVNISDPYWARMWRDKDIVETTAQTDKPVGGAAPAATAAPAVEKK